MQITNAGGDQPMEYYENMPRRELSSLLVRKKRKIDLFRDLVQCLTKTLKKKNKKDISMIGEQTEGCMDTGDDPIIISRTVWKFLHVNNQ